MEHDSDILDGIAAVAAYLGFTESRVKHMVRDHGLPVFRIGRRVLARRSSLSKWLAALEAGPEAGGNK